MSTNKISTNKISTNKINQLNELNISEYKKYLINTDIEELIKLKSKLDDSYYNSGESIFSDTRYDMIVDTRPDVAFDFLPYSKKMFCPKMSVGTTRVEPVVIDNGGGSTWQGLDDHCFIMDSTTHVIWNQRFRFTHELQSQIPLPCGNHSLLWEYAKVHGIESYTIPWFNSELVRPNVIDYQEQNFYIRAQISRHNWNKHNSEERKNIVVTAGVSEQDYAEAIQTYKAPE